MDSKTTIILAIVSLAVLAFAWLSPRLRRRWDVADDDYIKRHPEAKPIDDDTPLSRHKRISISARPAYVDSKGAVRFQKFPRLNSSFTMVGSGFKVKIGKRIIHAGYQSIVSVSVRPSGALLFTMDRPSKSFILNSGANWRLVYLLRKRGVSTEENAYQNMAASELRYTLKLILIYYVVVAVLYFFVTKPDDMVFFLIFQIFLYPMVLIIPRIRIVLRLRYPAAMRRIFGPSPYDKYTTG